MKIVGKCNFDRQEWNFELEDTCYGYVNFVTELYFTDGYNDFKYQFKNMKEFQEQYNKQEKNLFKLFFNDTTIDYESLDFDFNDWDTINIFRKTEELNPYFYENFIENSEDYYWELTNNIAYEFRYIDNEYKKFSYYLSDLLWYATEEVSNEVILSVYSYMFCNGMEQYTINDIKELNKEGTLELVEKLYGFSNHDKKYIEFAINY